MRFIRRSSEDKARALERAYADADGGNIALALERLADVRLEFPRDAILEYAEGILRKDHVGQGLRAQAQFLLAQQYDSQHLFSAFNAAKYAPTEPEYRERSAWARRLAPRDPDLGLFDTIDGALAQGELYGGLLAQFVQQAQEVGQHGDCAAVAEVALEAEEWDHAQELALRGARCQALRELDKVEELAHQARREYYPPPERLPLHGALAEMERAIALSPEDPKLWNFKSAWLILLQRYAEALSAADRALDLEPSGIYVKPMTNKAWCLLRLGRVDEARRVANDVLRATEGDGPIGWDIDRKLARGVLAAEASVSSNEEQLQAIADQAIRSATLRANEMQGRWQSAKRGFDLAKGLYGRSRRYGERWDDSYLTITAEAIHDFGPEWAWQAVLRLGDRNHAAYDHVLHAALYVAATAEGVMIRDACRFNVLVVLGAMGAARIRRVYREAVLAPVATDARFASLDERMREEMARLNPELPRLVAEQPPLDAADHQRAVSVTLLRFRDVNEYSVSSAMGRGRLAAMWHSVLSLLRSGG